MDEPIVLGPREGERLGASIVKAARPEPSLLDPWTSGGFVEYRRALAELRARGTTPDETFYARHDALDPG